VAIAHALVIVPSRTVLLAKTGSQQARWNR